MDTLNVTPVIGLTGGAGSGKSHIAEILHNVCNVCHINTDRISEAQMKRGGCVYQPVRNYFGDAFLTAEGEIDRKKLGEYIFQRPDELGVLNSITHPPVKEEVERRINQAKQEKKDVILLETALLFEAGYEAICDEIWYVYAKREVRRQRLMQTRMYTDERVRDMFRRQHTDRFFRMHADYVVENNDSDNAELGMRLQRRLKQVRKYNQLSKER